MKELFFSFNTINNENIAEKRLTLKNILLTLFTNYFSKHTTQKNNDIPLWLIQTCNRMNSQTNFVESIPAMVRISGKTYEHLSRSFKKVFGVTPSQYRSFNGVKP